MNYAILKTFVTFLLFILVSWLGIDLKAQQTEEEEVVEYPLILEYPFIDIPFNKFAAKSKEGIVSTENKDGKGNYSLTGVQSPEQATQLTNSIAMAGHWAISKVPLFKDDKEMNYIARSILTGGFDLLLFYAPLGSGWLHEEGHRAIMANSYTYSYNPFVFNKRKGDASGNGLHAVSYVLDTNLVMMKANDNPNFIRMSTMGGEMNIFSSMRMQQSAFFNNPTHHTTKRLEIKPLHNVYYLFNLLNTSLYIMTCGNKKSLTRKTEGQIDREGASQELRDFTGLDFAAWAYDLRRPDEPYSNRGLNSYGNGYDRYIYGDKLTDEEYKWLKKQGWLSFANLLSPMNFFIEKIKLGENSSFNFSGRYYPTPFGNQMG